MILHLENPSIRSETAVYILNSAVPKITFWRSSFSKVHDISTLQKLHTILLVSTCSIYCGTRSSRLRFVPESSSFEKRSRHILRIGGHWQLANIKLCLQATAANVVTSRCLATHSTLQLYLSFLVVLLYTSVSLLTSTLRSSYKSMPSYTKHSVTAEPRLSRSSGPH